MDLSVIYDSDIADPSGNLKLDALSALLYIVKVPVRSGFVASDGSIRIVLPDDDGIVATAREVLAQAGFRVATCPPGELGGTAAAKRNGRRR